MRQAAYYVGGARAVVGKRKLTWHDGQYILWHVLGHLARTSFDTETNERQAIGLAISTVKQLLGAR